MPTSPDPINPHREHPSTYFVPDRSNEDELSRLHIQDHLLTASMGGVFSEQTSPINFRRVLDVGCGTGDWLIEAAIAYPGISQLVGVDVSSKVLEYARMQAVARGVDDRVEFYTMDALRMLEFPNMYFDLVNQRLGMSYLRTWDWPKLLQEYQRVCASEGMLRITEADFIASSTSPALKRLYDIALPAFYKAGYYPKHEHDGVICALADLLHRYGVQRVDTRLYRLEYRFGTAEWQDFYEDIRLVFQTVLPFLYKWTHLPDDYDTIYRQALREMRQPGFVTTWDVLTAWGYKK